MDALWYYASGNNRLGPVGEADLLKLHQSGVVKADDLVWTDGMKDWAPLKTTALAARFAPPAVAAVPAVPPPAPVQAIAQQPVRAILPDESQLPLAPVPPGLSGWMKFNGVMLILQGAGYCMGCIWIIIGVPLIMAGIACFSGASVLDNLGGVSGGSLPFFQKLKSFNLGLGIFHIITIVLTIIGVILGIIFFGALMATLQKTAGGSLPF